VLGKGDQNFTDWLQGDYNFQPMTLATKNHEPPHPAANGGLSALLLKY
jgi:hypothetical protein